METFWPWKQNIRRSHTTTSVQFTFCQSLWEPPHPPSIFTVGGLASLEGVPQGTLSHTHLGSDTVALNETRHLRLGLAFQSQTCTWGRCGDAVLAYLRHLKQEVRLKGDSERDQTHRWEIFLYFHLCLHSIFTSISYPDWPPKCWQRWQMLYFIFVKPGPHPVTNVNLHLLAPHCTISLECQPVLACRLALFKERPIRHSSGQAACVSPACSLLSRPCQTRPAQYAPTKSQTGPRS